MAIKTGQKNTDRAMESVNNDLSNRQASIGFVSGEVASSEMGNSDFRFSSIRANHIGPGSPASDEGRLYIKDGNGVLYYITALKKG